MRTDLQHALKSLAARPGLTALAVAALAIALLANLVTFVVMEATLLRQSGVIPYDRLGFVFSLRQDFDPFGTNLIQYDFYRARVRSSIERFGLAQEIGINAGEGASLHPLRAGAVFSDYFATLGVKPALGRVFNPEEERTGAGRPVILSDRLWRRQFHARADAIGRTIRLDGQLHTVVGVMPAEMELPRDCALWLPLALEPATLPEPRRISRGYQLIARLRPDARLAAAAAELRAANRALQEEQPALFDGWGVALLPLRRQLIGDLSGRVVPTLAGLQGGVALLLLIAGGNLASLALGRSLTRSREYAVRQALGAPAARIRRLLGLEQSLIALAAFGLTLLLFSWVRPLLEAWRPIEIYAQAGFLAAYPLSAASVAGALAAALGIAWFSGWLAARPLIACEPSHALRAGVRAAGAASRRPFRLMIAGQIALATLLATGAGLMVLTLRNLQRLDLGFDPDGVHVWPLTLPQGRYDAHEPKLRLADNVLREIRALPGVIAADFSTNFPMEDGTSDISFLAEGRAWADTSEVPIAANRLVTPDYLRTLGLQLVRGRFLEESDRADSLPVVVICEELARQAFAGADPIGRRLRLGNPRAAAPVFRTVVGLVRPVKEDWFNYRVDRPVVYVPYHQQNASRFGTPRLTVRAAASPAALDPAIRSAISRHDGDVAAGAPVAVAAHLGRVLKTETTAARLALALAVLAVALAATGLFGVVTLLASARTREYGVRLTLGATPRMLLGSVLREGLALTLTGAVLGLGLSLAAARWAGSLVHGVDPRSPGLYLGVTGLLLLVSLLACFLPARKAAKADPISALRAD